VVLIGRRAPIYAFNGRIINSPTLSFLNTMPGIAIVGTAPALRASKNDSVSPAAPTCFILVNAVTCLTLLSLQNPNHSRYNREGHSTDSCQYLILTM
jgi:hypothetical protein